MPAIAFEKIPERLSWPSFANATTREAFCQGWLALQGETVSEMEAAVVLLCPADGRSLAPVAVWSRSPRNLEHLMRAAEVALEQRCGLLLPRSEADAPGASWREWVEVTYPIDVCGRVDGVVVFEIVPASASHLQEIVQHLMLAAGWLEVLLHRHPAIETPLPQERLRVVLDILATLLEPEAFEEAATALVTDLATQLRCERVSLGFVRGHRVQLHTMSHSAQFGKKTNLARAIENAMDETFDQGASLVYPPLADAAFQIRRTHEALSRQHGASAICSVLLTHGQQTVGVLTFERTADHPFDASTVELAEAIAAFVGPILEEKRLAHRCLLAKAADASRVQLKRLIGPRHTGRKLVMIGLVAVMLFFAVAKANYRVVATTIIEARTERVAVAPFDGYIAEALVSAGDLVKAGDILCTLDDRELKLEALKWQSQRDQYVKQSHLAMAQGDAASVKITKAQVAQIEAELARVQDQLDRTLVRAPFDGVVVSGDLSQSIGTPVERGQELFTVAPLDSYRVTLQVDERDTTDIAVGQRGHVALSAFPTRLLPFRVEKLTPVSITRDGRNYFRVEAQLEHPPAHLRPGMEGVGKIDVGRRRLIWNWTHRAIDWWRLFIWSWWP